MNLKRQLLNIRNRFEVRGKNKIFGIGANKTGTTSLKIAMKDLGYLVGNQRESEKFIHDWAKRDFRKIIKYCESAQFFQDSPFSYPYTYVALDQAFPNSKFILTVRNSSDQWYNSLVNFHASKWSKDKNPPSKEDLMNAVYQWKGRQWQANRYMYDSPEDEPYRKENLIKFYETHNAAVKEYFRHRPDDLLVLNVSDENAYSQLVKFLDLDVEIKGFPWKKKSDKNVH